MGRWFLNRSGRVGRIIDATVQNLDAPEIETMSWVLRERAGLYTYIFSNPEEIVPSVDTGTLQ